MRDSGEFDYIVVGGGAAGCVLANRLSADPANSVLLLEAGNDEKWIWTRIPVGYLYCINNPRTDWCYTTQPEAGLNGRSIIYARGKGLGGCTLINGMLYLRGQSRDYDEWAGLTGDNGWCWDSVLSSFKQMENHWSGGNEHHGGDGEWRVEKQRLGWEILDRFAEAAQQTGIPFSQDFNGGDNLGVNNFEVNQKRGTRWSAVRAFLDPIRNRANLKIITGALSDKLSFDGARVSGIEFMLGGERHLARCRAELVLSAGALGSPSILQRSGIGAGAAVQAFGLDTLSDLPGVGGNLQDHLQLRSVYKVQGITTLNQQANSWWGQFKMGLEYALKRTGPLTMAPSQLGMFARSDESVETPDLEFHVQPLSLDKFGDDLHDFPAFTASVCHLRPESRGTVCIPDTDPNSMPLIAPNYLSCEADQRIAVKALSLTRRIAEQRALAPYKPQEHLPGPDYRSGDDLVRAAGDIGTTIFHPVGTCKMGRDSDPQAVTDSRLRVRGVQGLRVVDASVMPTITSGNTSSPTLMIAQRGAQMILADNA
ncbi:MAG: GMC family oxidoreductase [Granulosicoccaceae bacterium]